MGMDMKYFWTGTAIKADLHFNSPMLLAVNINPDKTKAIIRLKEEVNILLLILDEYGILLTENKAKNKRKRKKKRNMYVQLVVDILLIHSLVMSLCKDGRTTTKTSFAQPIQSDLIQ